VVNLICGAGQTGKALVRSPLASLVSFTGHADTGKRVMANAASNLTRVSLELGGTDRYVAAAQAIQVGFPREGSDTGPLVSKAQHDKTTAALEGAISEGATIATGGGRPDGDAFLQGYWYAPTVLRDIRPEMRVMHDETFGPVTPILAIDSLDEAIGVANDTPHHAGFKESGIGGEDGKWGPLRYTQIKTAYHHYG
jgi:lactaldehyde dehydrogenase/glycolaldehyde dehydrogenase